MGQRRIIRPFRAVRLAPVLACVSILLSGVCQALMPARNIPRLVERTPRILRGTVVSVREVGDAILATKRQDGYGLAPVRVKQARADAPDAGSEDSDMSSEDEEAFFFTRVSGTKFNIWDLDPL